jgi:hypothetical protein
MQAKCRRERENRRLIINAESEIFPCKRGEFRTGIDRMIRPITPAIREFLDGIANVERNGCCCRPTALLKK